jgi:S-adenosylmethionine synthetase
MLEDVDLKDFVVKTLEETPQNIIINASGSYTYHSSIADCGITGRKLAVDFYSTACPIGGGSPWTKDASKADLTLNLYARKLAVENLQNNDECFVYLSSCIGKHELPSATIKFIKGNNITTRNLAINKKPYELIKELGLDKSIYSKLCSIGIINAC